MSALPLQNGESNFNGFGEGFGAFSDGSSYLSPAPGPSTGSFVGPPQLTPPPMAPPPALGPPESYAVETRPSGIETYGPGPLPAPPESVGAPVPGTTVPADDAHSLGIALLLVGVGTAVGVKYGGAFGGVAGGLYGGSAVNIFRAARNVSYGTPDADHEALISGTYAVIGAGLASFLLWKTFHKEKKTHE